MQSDSGLSRRGLLRQSASVLGLWACQEWGLPGTSLRTAEAQQAPASTKGARAGSLITLQATGPQRPLGRARVALDPQIPAGPLQLRETTGGSERVVDVQVEPAREPNQPHWLWWIVDGGLPPQGQRTFRLEAASEPAPHRVEVSRNRSFVGVEVGQRPMLRYNAAHVAPATDVDPKYGRSAHIHPAQTPSGLVVTDEFPPDHLHQSGLFLAYTKTEFEGRSPNFWDLLGGTGRVRFQSLKSTSSGPVWGEFTTVHQHVDTSGPTEKIPLTEEWRLQAWSLGGPAAGYWLCDITTTRQAASDTALKILQYHYGGMALRGDRGWTPKVCQIRTSEGQDRLAGNHSRPHWAALQGPVQGKTAGLALLTHPANFRFPEPVRIHPDMPYLVYTPAQLGDFAFEPGQPQTSHYRFVFFDGEIAPRQLDALWEDFAHPWTATVD
jgi:hypothetical protein